MMTQQSGNIEGDALMATTTIKGADSSRSGLMMIM